MTVTTAGGGFGQVPRWVFLHPSVRKNRWANDVYTYLAIVADRSTADQVANRYRSTLAKELGCSTDTIDRATAVLVDIGALVVHRRRADNGDNLANEYIIKFDPPSRTAAATPPERGQGAAPERGGGRTPAARGPHPRGPLQEPLIQEPSGPEVPAGPSDVETTSSERRSERYKGLPVRARLAPRPDEPGGFSEWWDHYPGGGTRAATSKAFQAALRRGMDLDDLARATVNYHQDCTLVDRFYMHGKSFLTGDAWQEWLDWTPPAVARKGKPGRAPAPALLDGLDGLADYRASKERTAARHVGVIEATATERTAK